MFVIYMLLVKSAFVFALIYSVNITKQSLFVYLIAYIFNEGSYQNIKSLNLCRFISEFY